MRDVFLCLIAGIGAFTPVHGAVRMETHKMHLSPVAAGQSPYVYLPFEVPPRAEEIVAHLDYDRAGGSNAIDFAIFDSSFSGRDDDLTGYRGKNPNRQPLVSVIGRTHASDGHLPGPLPPGTWRVMFYVYKSQPSGIDIALDISIVTDGKPDPDSGPRWFRGDLHSHTLHSDGSWTVPSLAAAAQLAGLDFLAITDHNTASHHSEIDGMPVGGPLLIKGVEITTYGGHMNAWGVPAGRVLEHRQLPGDNAALQRMVTDAHQIGARISINHPFADCKACDWGFAKDAPNFDGIEVWNGSWGPEDQRALEWWESLLKAGRRITAIGSSDSHGSQNELGVPTIHLFAQRRDPTALLDAIAAGRATITASPRIRASFEAKSDSATAGPGQELSLAARNSIQFFLVVDEAPASEVILYSAEGEIQRWLVTNSSFRQEITIPASSRFYRMEVRGVNESMIALTNPIWVRTY
jgi:hypothetical protein